MLENLNRIFGACFPPLVILGWLGAGIFLYTAFRSGEWRKKLTGMEGFLALLLLFMMANRIPNPAIISFRYVIGIGVLTLFWSVWLLRWSWHNCPTPLRRWRGMLLLALIFGICLGGFLKEIRLSERTRRETEVICFLRDADFFTANGTNRILLGTEPRLERIVVTAARKQVLDPLVVNNQEELTDNLRIARYVNQEMYVLLNKQEEKEHWPEIISGNIATDHWEKIEAGKQFGIYRVIPKKQLFGQVVPMPPRNKRHVIYEDFEHGEEINPARMQIRLLREKGVGFAQVPIVLPTDWLPNPTHGSYEPEKEKMELKLIPQGINCSSLFFSGKGSGSIMKVSPLSARERYRGAFIFRGTPESKVEIVTYLYNANRQFIRSEKLASAEATSARQLILVNFSLEQLQPEVCSFRIAISLEGGTILIDNFVVEKL
ncbi:hypothetical protein HF882_16430 [Victivallis vadensis]|uniref:Uncharacterized protein n=1 Tax=Victivallis vadensis TaxID=172901 RepID=A0A848B0G8_9BACT|nr:hypothetical protein [Victivallis vadensis]NMD88173.1 hypothetical protein [Victivallis vadensis]